MSSNIIGDSDVFAKWIGLQTVASKLAFTQQIEQWKYDKQQLVNLSEKCKRFKAIYEKDPTFFKKCQDIFHEIASIEEKLTALVQTESELERESYSELLFFKPFMQPLNFIPYVLSIWSAFRVYILPGLSLLIPILTLIAPYLIITFVFRIPMTFTNYVTILHTMMSGNFDKMMDPNVQNDLIENQFLSLNLSSIMKQLGLVIITVLQGVIQPYWAHIHLKSIDTIIHDQGRLVLRFKELYSSLSELLLSRGFTTFRCPLPEMDGERDATARIILESTYFKLAMKYIGLLEVILCITHHPDIYPVRWVSSDTPVFRIRDTFDFNIADTSDTSNTSNTSNRKKITVDLTVNRHALLTGPNKGGKSTVLRSLSISALLAHTYGCAIGHLTSTPFKDMYVCLKPDDLPGVKSRFEREIEFTASTLRCKQPILVFIDELYHSTNPPDALRSCEIYCAQLWKKSNAISVISTHLFEFVDHADEKIQRLCCPAVIDDNGEIQFLYLLEKGICKVSSVDMLLKSNGLISTSQCV